TPKGASLRARVLPWPVQKLASRGHFWERSRGRDWMRIDTPDSVALRTKPGVVNLAQLVRSTMRLRPDRIIVGEVRGAEALDMLKAWNTGHPGGIATVHANSARAALYRLEQLIQEAVVTVPRRLIAEAIDLVVFIQGRGTGRRVETIAEMTGLDDDGDYRVHDLAPCKLLAL
ncbi:MAG: Flp pilus assembly complex ATPase component TadA, partial [Alphaproteobacteria bacterium]|nr:Flp pilus assembly complex ATPase component TadA [Alphaproteobacteria bacterium]